MIIVAVSGPTTAANVSIWVVIIPAALTLVGTAATMLAARYSARRAGETDTIKLGVTELVDQLREERSHLEDRVGKCTAECEKLRRDVIKANAQHAATASELEDTRVRLTQAETSLRALTHELAQRNHVIELREAELVELRRKEGQR